MPPPKAFERLARTILLLAPLLWAGSLPLAAYAAGRFEQAPRVARVFSVAIYEIGSIICHQRPERTFRLGQVPLPVCARCSGLYLGAALTMLVVCFSRLSRRTAAHGPLWSNRAVVRLDPARRARLVLAIATLPTLVTLVYEWSSGVVPSNDVRAMTGVLLGAVLAWVLLQV